MQQPSLSASRRPGVGKAVGFGGEGGCSLSVLTREQISHNPRWAGYSPGMTPPATGPPAHLTAPALTPPAVQQLRAALHQLYQREAAAVLQPPHVRAGAGGVQEGGHRVGVH